MPHNQCLKFWLSVRLGRSGQPNLYSHKSLFEHVSLLKPDKDVKLVNKAVILKFTTFTPFVGNKKFFQIVVAYGRPKILMENQKL